MGLLNLILKLIAIPFNFLTKTDSRIWICGAWSGLRFGDNPRYLYEYLNSDDYSGDIQCYWYTKDINCFKELQSKNLPVIYGFSLKAIWMHLHASRVFCNCAHATDLLWACIGYKTKVINLWHGSPVKKIGMDAVVEDSSKLEQQSILKKVLAILRKLGLSALKAKVYYVAPSEFVGDILQSAFAVEETHIIHSMNAKIHPLAKSGWNPEGKILYAPTYRGEYGSEENILETFGFDIEVTDKWLEERGKKLVIRLHPANYPSEDLIQKITNSKNVLLDKSEDLYEKFSTYDLIVSDFSSLIFDSLAVGIPTLIAPFGYKKYIESDRDLYITIKELCPYDAVETWAELFSLIDRVELSSVNDVLYPLSIKYNKYNFSHSINDLIDVVYTLD